MLRANEEVCAHSKTSLVDVLVSDFIEVCLNSLFKLVADTLHHHSLNLPAVTKLAQTCQYNHRLRHMICFGFFICLFVLLGI